MRWISCLGKPTRGGMTTWELGGKLTAIIIRKQECYKLLYGTKSLNELCGTENARDFQHVTSR
jgi:hypothetical protein